MSLAVKYRPHTFDEGLVEQTITTEILKRQIKNRTFKNGYLFTGPSGVGKTTIGRIFANTINNGIGDPLEIDAASNNGVDNIRAIIESANTRAITGEYKVFLIDECHMITTAGWNAFLKCLEECPKYTIFIFCSTNPEKLPPAILNRLQRFNFAKISANGIKNRLEYICQQEGFTNYKQTCEFLSKICQGGMRDAITYLEQIADYSTDLSIDVAKKLLSGLSYETMFKLTWAITQKKPDEILTLMETLYTEGQDLRNFINNYLDFVLDLLKFIILKDISVTNIPEYLATAENPTVQYTINIENNLEYFNNLVDKILAIKQAIKSDINYKSTIEVLLIDATRG